MEKQNRDVLASMNNRARLQLRLQQTVEGLSVAAVSYYVVGLIGYLAKGTTLFGLEAEAGICDGGSGAGRPVACLVGGAEHPQVALRDREGIDVMRNVHETTIEGLEQ